MKPHVRTVQKGILAASVSALLLAPVPAVAASTDPLIEGAKLCTRHLPRVERMYGVPVHLLSAIASTESGRYHKGLKISIPWPWTINAEGKGYYFDTKQEAINAAKRLRAQGVRSMDVGCMQVNLHHHPDAFASLEEAFDPEKNINYSASFLRSLYDEMKSWKEAAASYHSRTPVHGTRYVSNVFDRWHDIINRVRVARKITDVKETNLAAGQGEQGIASTAQLASASAVAAFANAGAAVPAARLSPSAAPPTPAQQEGPYGSTKVIKVRTVAEERPAQTLVISPKVADAPTLKPQAQPPVLSASAAPAAMTQAQSLVLADAAKAPIVPAPLAVDTVYPKDRADVVSGHRAGPRFIFNE